MERKLYLDILSILFLMALTFYYFYHFYASFLRILFVTVGTIVILTVTPYLLIRKYKEKLYKYKIANFFMDWHHYLGFPFVLVFFYLSPSFPLFLVKIATWQTRFDYESLVFPFTYAFMVLTFIISFALLYRKRTHLLVSFIYAVSMVLGSSAIYELVFNIFFTYTGKLGFEYEMYMLLFTVSGLVSSKNWKFGKSFFISIVVEAVFFLLWNFLALGIPSSFNSYQFLFNLITKGLMFFIFVLPLWEGLKNTKTTTSIPKYSN